MARLVRAVAATSQARTDVVFGFDDDDPSLRKSALAAVSADVQVKVVTGPRRGLAEWTNVLALAAADFYPALASFGDDHVPQTPGWDKLLLDAIEGMGGTGISYPNDQVRADVCEAWVMSSGIVRALGWMCEPSLAHWYVDNVIHDLGTRAGCLQYLPDVIVRHNHPAAGRGQFDKTYFDAYEGLHDDRRAYEAWCATRRSADVAKVRALRGKARA